MGTRAGGPRPGTLITGLRGTLAPHFARRAEAAGHEVLGWDRERVPPEDPAAGRAHLDREQPDSVLHLALGAEEWAAQLAGWCREHDRRFAYTSTAMVFDVEPDGPHHPDQPPNARDDYGRYKARCERRILEANPDALIVRIGWQIDPAGGGNNMARQLSDQHREQGHVDASELWTPAASLMSDTADVTWRLLEEGAVGVHHLDANAEDALRFPEVVERLGAALGQDWNVRTNRDYRHDQRLVDARVKMPSLRERLSFSAASRGSDTVDPDRRPS